MGGGLRRRRLPDVRDGQGQRPPAARVAQARQRLVDQRQNPRPRDRRHPRPARGQTVGLRAGAAVARPGDLQAADRRRGDGRQRRLAPGLRLLARQRHAEHDHHLAGAAGHGPGERGHAFDRGQPPLGPRARQRHVLRPGPRRAGEEVRPPRRLGRRTVHHPRGRGEFPPRPDVPRLGPEPNQPAPPQPRRPRHARRHGLLRLEAKPPQRQAPGPRPRQGDRFDNAYFPLLGG